MLLGYIFLLLILSVTAKKVVDEMEIYSDSPYYADSDDYDLSFEESDDGKKVYLDINKLSKLTDVFYTAPVSHCQFLIFRLRIRQRIFTP